MMFLKEQIRKIRKELDLTQQKFADRLGVKRNTIAMYEMGKTVPSDQTIKSICREFNVNEEWLRNGTGEMCKPAPSDELDMLAYRYHLSEADYVMIEKFVSLRPETRQTVFNYMKEVAASFEGNGVEPFSPAYGNEPSQPMDDILNTRQETEAEHRPSIDEQVEEYRRQLVAEEKAAGESSALQKDA